MFTGFKGTAKKLEDVDLPRIGAEIGIGEDPLHALIEVETRGTGFDKQGRVLMLFEPHVFYRVLRKLPGTSGSDKLTEAVEQGLAYRKWRRDYPADSYPRLLRAMEIDETAALKAASWGLPQILGENHAAAGFDSPQEMVSAFADDEDVQLQAMIKFLVANHIDDDLRRIQRLAEAGKIPTAADWVPVVRVYNGAGYADNNYHNRAAKAFAKWLRIKDTPQAKSLTVLQRAADEQVEAAETERDDGTQSSAPASGVTSPSTDRKEVQITSMSPTTKRIAIGGILTAVIGAVQQVWASSQETVLTGAQLLLKHLPIVLLILGIAALAIWLYNRAADRAAKRLDKVIDIAADKNKHDVIIT